MNKMRLAAVVCWMCVPCVWGQQGKITVRVTDIDGKPISGAHVEAGFSTSLSAGEGWGAGSANEKSGLTDTNGICVLSGHGDGGSVAVAASKEGYYGSDGYQIVFTNVTWGLGRRWQPWNPTFDVVLKKVENPIPMYARRLTGLRLPAVGEDIGYDLMAGDWTPPHGKGETADLVFRFDREECEPETWYRQTIYPVNDTLTVTFPNPGDGLFFVSVPKYGSSVLRLEGPAPETGYVPVLEKHQWHSPGRMDMDDDANYYLRIRTKLDDKGNVVSALYGKIYGDVCFANRGDLTFTYFLNPISNDRNVEFNPERNLFGNPVQWGHRRARGVFVP